MTENCGALFVKDSVIIACLLGHKKRSWSLGSFVKPLLDVSLLGRKSLLGHQSLLGPLTKALLGHKSSAWSLKLCLVIKALFGH